MNTTMRELFIDELAQVTGGADPLEKVKQAIHDLIPTETTQACCEEGQCYDQ